MVDPRIAFQYKDAVNQAVANPFFNILTVDKFPGPLRYQQQVSISSLMKPYPQYGSIDVTDGQPGGNMKYHSLQIKLQKNFSRGYSMLLGYNYHYEQDQRYYDGVDNYLKQYTWINAPNSRHRLSVAGTWEVPLGRGRSYMSNVPRVVDALVGGWDLTPVMFWRSGRYAQFGGMVVNGDPHISNPGPEHGSIPRYFRRCQPTPAVPTHGCTRPSPDRDSSIWTAPWSRHFTSPRSSGSSCAWMCSTCSIT